MLGVDGLSPYLVTKLVARGVLPNFARLVREGRFGYVSTLDNGLPSLSARIWTSYATGQLPARHGIEGFYHRDGVERVLNSSNDRLSPAVWEIASTAGKRVGVINWLMTYPAEPVNGFVVSDHYLPSTIRTNVPSSDGSSTGLVFPPSLLGRLQELGIESAATPPWTAEAAEREDRNVLRIAYAALAEHPVDLLLVYTRATDELQHVAWSTHDPFPGEPRAPRDEIEEYIRRYDGLLGELLAHLTPADHLILLSDHGAERNPDRNGLPGTHASRRAAVGTLLLLGPRIMPGLITATSTDIAPTLLELLGVPPPADMPGHVLVSALAPDPVLLPRAETPYARRPRTPVAADQVDGPVRERLNQLGYVQ